ncbi:MAG: glycine cleavage system aminomethyltransferase GcvT, partial [FCB group bacterium]|nr:glycine cleavage system aminomethyltransferase GcvT [FCB group bacterium]
YSGIIQEHLAVRNYGGLFDVSHMGEFYVTGEGAETFLQFLTLNDVTTLQPGDAQYSAMCNSSGGILDDLIIYRYGPDRFMVVVNAANIDKDFQWFFQHCPGDVSLENRSSDISLIAFQGPLSREILSGILNIPLEDLGFYTFRETEAFGATITVARTGYTGELGFEVYGPHTTIPEIWDAILDRGASKGIIPAGLGARDTLRLEMKYCLYGNDIDETTNPLEAGLGWITKLDKGDFIGREALLEAKANLTRRLVCFELQERGIPRHGYRIFRDSTEVGVVTSGGQSPSLKKGIGLGYVPREFAKSGNRVSVEIRGKQVPAIIVKPPFYKGGSLHN